MNLDQINKRREKLLGQLEFFIGDARRYLQDGFNGLVRQALNHAIDVMVELRELKKEEEKENRQLWREHHEVA